MKMFDYIDAARAKGVPLSRMDISIYMRSFATPEVRHHFYQNFEIIDVDPQEILDKSNQYLDSRQITSV